MNRLSLVALAWVLAACSFAMQVTIEPGLVPRMTPDQVAAIALREIAAMEGEMGGQLASPRIVSAEAFSRGGRILNEPRFGPMPGDDEIFWRVVAEGTFLDIGPRIEPPVAPSHTGWFMIRDKDRSVVDFGFP